MQYEKINEMLEKTGRVRREGPLDSRLYFLQHFLRYRNLASEGKIMRESKRT